MLSFEDYRKCLVTNLLSVKDAVKEHKLLIQSEKDIQLVILERLWVLAHRYTTLARGAPTRLHMPNEEIHRPEDVIKTEFLAKVCALESSNLKLASSLSVATNNFNGLQQFLDEMEVEHLSSLDKASSIQISFASCIEILGDFIKYYTKFESQINCYALLLRAASVISVENYKKLWETNKEFVDYFNKTMATLHILKKTK